MKRFRRVASAKTEEVAENRTRVIASTNELARDGHVVEPSGLKTANFLRTAAILFNHNGEHPVATPVSAALTDGGDKLEVELEWPPAGTSLKSDEVRRLVKAGVLRAVSIGFDPIEMEPLDPKNPWGGQHITEADLIELSWVGAPADTGAVVTQRSDNAAEDDREVYLTSSEDARPEDGIGEADRCDLPEEVKELRSAMRGSEELAARFKEKVERIKTERKAHRHPADNLSAKERARREIAHEDYGYRFADTKHMKYGLQNEKDIRASWSYIHMPKNRKGYTEAELKAIERRIVAAWKKKVDPAGPPEADEDQSVNQQHDQGRSALVRRLTKKVAGFLQAALKHSERGAEHRKALEGHHEAAADHLETAVAAHERCRGAHEQMRAALESAVSEPEKAPEHLARAMKLHEAVAKHHRAVREAHANVEGAHEDAEDTLEALGRCARGAHAAIAKALESPDNIPGDEDDEPGQDGDSDLTQSSGGIGQSGGSDNGRSATMDALRRRFRLLKLAG